MPTPSQTFTTIQQLINYVNTFIITNGDNEITGEQANNVLNGLATFIQTYTINASGAAISSATSGIVVLPKPVTVFSQVPTSVQWADNVQKEFYIVNATGLPIPLTNGYSYTDAYGVSQTSIPARTAIHIAKTGNASWVQINNLPGNGGGGDLPPQAGNQGRFLWTNGTTTAWMDPGQFIDNSDFDPDGVTVKLPALQFNKFEIYFDTLGGYIYQQDGQWDYVSGGGFKILIPGINANTSGQLRLHLFLKGLNS